eukprot:TRINITY_DN1347_c0_g1_i8.p1 TRINITY_DN1347_c0_g1~~TRINITY_DN1347_c0_g1_i8.p1  ORF type:complete len:664 (+),score=175.12 TRINITY_DN1347_c0_g1_i8:68-1993(+)
MVLRRCCRAVVRRAARDADTAEERRRKEIFVPMMAGLSILCVFYQVIFMQQSTANPLQASILSMHCITVGCFVGVLTPLATRRLSTSFVGLVTVALSAAICLGDLSYAAGRDTFRPWSYVVLVMDVHLALDVPRQYQRVALHSTAAWVLVTYVEDAFRLGLYDVDKFSNRAEYVRENNCDCANPPCSQGAITVFNFFMPFVVLFLDFFATRGFAEGLRSEQAKVSASVVTAEQVAEGLAGFDLKTAEYALEQAGGALPERLYASFRRLLRNLARYRPYLPQSCFEEGDNDAFVPETSADSSSYPHDGCSSGRRQSTAIIVPGRQVSIGPSVRSSRIAGADSATESLCSSSAASGTPVLHRQHVQQMRRVTLLVRNSTGFLAAAREHPQSVAGWLAEEVQRFADVISGQSGMSDLLSGDHFSASFGALKVQGSQCISATRAAVLLTAAPSDELRGSLAGLHASAAVCSGKALCGDFGSSAVQRFMVIGGVASFSMLAERAAAAWRLPLLIDTVAHADAEQLWCCRLRKLAVFPKVGMKHIGLWEVLKERMHEGECQEYELADAQSNPWAWYNAAVARWCEATAAEALSAVAAGLGEAEPGGAVAAALRALRDAIQKGAAPPVGGMTPAALMGDPSPVADLAP